MAKTAVLYLARFGNAPRFSRAFLHSLATHRAGADYDLFYILKGYKAQETDPNLMLFRGAIPHPIHEVRVSDDKFATNVFLDVARTVDHFERVLFFVSYSRVLAPHWLSTYLQAFERVPSCGVVGATGGYESIPGTTFPNVSIRTNAFMIDRRLLLDLDPGSLERKIDGNYFEAGPDSMTKQIVRRGLVPVVVDRWGKIWNIEDWPESRTFRSGNQEGLLVSDNRTWHYQVAGLAKRNKLARLNWGDRAVVSTPSIWSRARAAHSWYWPSARPSD